MLKGFAAEFINAFSNLEYIHRFPWIYLCQCYLVQNSLMNHGEGFFGLLGVVKRMCSVVHFVCKFPNTSQDVSVGILILLPNLLAVLNT